MKSDRDRIISNLNHTTNKQATHLLGIVRQGVVGVSEEDVLRLEIGVGEFVVMEELDGVTQLVGNVSDLIEGVWTVVVVLL